ncbi:AAA family ATPase [Desulfotruncus alcoholivorax]|uniref:AAA family ATPase n=1 Tax=Desulfotruncus alcoholivorax TaxID=265477 RepID=UPI0009D64EF8|nr:MoxR family ATPase [Desulfotruncus alcoholivorax]
MVQELIELNEDYKAHEETTTHDKLTGGGDAAVREVLEKAGRRLQEMEDAIGAVIIGQKDVVHQVLIAMLAGGHVLLEGVPGLGKTALVRTIGGVTGLGFRRIQFTPDLMPADITGTQIYDAKSTGQPFKFIPGPVFSNILLADEINRATPKTQSALLEAMQEKTVTVGGAGHPLPEPFFVLATQNPLEMEGTYPLPEAQLDRFIFKINVSFPTAEELAAIGNLTTGADSPVIKKVLEPGEMLQWQQLVRKVVVVKDIMDYAVQLVLSTRPDSPTASEQVRRYVRYGSGPRGLQALLLGARAEAFRAGRASVGYEDIRKVAAASLRHRLLLNFEAAADGITPDTLIQSMGV